MSNARQELILELSIMAKQMRRIADKMYVVRDQDCINNNCKFYNADAHKQCLCEMPDNDCGLKGENACLEYMPVLSEHARQLRGAAGCAETWVEGLKHDLVSTKEVLPIPVNATQ